MAKYGDLAIHLGSAMGEEEVCEHKNESEPFTIVTTSFVRCLDCGQVRATMEK